MLATDVDGDSLGYTLATGPAHGTLRLNADGSFSYAPNADFSKLVIRNSAKRPAVTNDRIDIQTDRLSFNGTVYWTGALETVGVDTGNDKAVDRLLGAGDHNWYFAFANDTTDRDPAEDR